MNTIKLLSEKVSLSVVALVLASCASGAHYDAQRLREEALRYHEDQVMDNLIRAKNGQVVLHVDIETLDANVETTVSGKVDGGQTLTRGVAGAFSASRPLTFSATPFQRMDKLTFTTKPVNDDDDAYLPYIVYLQQTSPSRPLQLKGGKNIEIPIEYDPNGPLLRSESLPPEEAYVEGAIKKKGKFYYYVPVSYQHRYFELCMALINHGVATPSTWVGGGTSKASSGSAPAAGEPKKSSPLKLQMQMNTLLRQLRDLR